MSVGFIFYIKPCIELVGWLLASLVQFLFRDFLPSECSCALVTWEQIAGIKHILTQKTKQYMPSTISPIRRLCVELQLLHFTNCLVWVNFISPSPSVSNFSMCSMSFVLYLHKLMIYTCVCFRTKAGSALRYLPLFEFHPPMVQTWN